MVSLICVFSLIFGTFPVDAATETVSESGINSPLSGDMSPSGFPSYQEEEGGYIPLAIDHDICSTTEDRDYDSRIASVGADSDHEVMLYASGAGSSYYPASYTDSEAVLAGLKQKMPPTRNQGSYQTCWSFATIASLEGSLIRERGYAPATVDASELHLAYYAEHYSLDNGDGRSDRVTFNGANYLGYGGNAFVALGALSNRSGAIPESDMPYSGAAATLEGKLAAPQDASDYRVTGWQAFDLSSKGDWELIKAAIRNQGSVMATIYTSSGSNKYNSTHHSFYNSNTGINHAVSLVGWDDDFPAGYFGGSVPGNGAWIVRNSWSTATTFDKDSYFYMSYYNPANYNSSGRGHAAYAVNAVECSNDYDMVYQYDGAIVSLTGVVNTGNIQQGANVFTASRDETLKAVSFQTYYRTANTEYEVNIYKDVIPGSGDPTDGDLVSTAGGYATAPGFYRVALQDEVSLKKGTVFSVVVTLKKTDGNPYLSLETMTSDAGWLNQSTAINPGQSYIKLSGSGGWVDLANYDGAAYGNVKIKAFTDPGTYVEPKMNLNETCLEMSPGGQATLSVNSFDPEDAVHGDKVTFSSDNGSVATVSENGVITAVSPGEAIITVSCDDTKGGVIRANCLVKVSYFFMKLDRTYLELSPGGTETLSVNSFEPEGAPHGDTVYYSSDNESVALVSADGRITAAAPGTAVVTASCDDTHGGVIKAECTVKVAYSRPLKLSLSKTGTVTLNPGDSFDLTAQVVPADAARDVYFISSSPRVASVDSTENKCVITAGVTGKAKITAVSGKLTKTLTIKVTAGENTHLEWDDIGDEELYPGENYLLLTDQKDFVWQVKSVKGYPMPVSLNKSKNILTVKKAGRAVINQLNKNNKKEVLATKTVTVAQPLISFRLNNSLVKAAAPKQGKVRRVSITAVMNPGYKRFSSSGGILSWNVTGGEWITKDPVKSRDAKAVFVIDSSARSGESVYVIATVTDPVTGTEYRDICQILIR